MTPLSREAPSIALVATSAEDMPFGPKLCRQRPFRVVFYISVFSVVKRHCLFMVWFGERSSATTAPLT